MIGTLHAVAATHDLGVFGLSRPGSGPPPTLPVAAWQSSQKFSAQAMPRLTQASLAWLRVPGGHPSDSWYSADVLAELSSLIGELQPRLVVLESLWLHRYIAPLQELDCQVVLNAHGVESELQDELAKTSTSVLIRIFAERTRELEAAAFAAADQVWVPSEHDAELARARYGDAVRVAIVPNGIDVRRYAGAARPADTFTVAFAANFGYPPNLTATRRLLSGILPLLRACVPDARLALIGGEDTGEMRAAAERSEWIEVTGAVDDVASHLQTASAMAIPLSEGHGTRFKVLEAFACGLPVVATRKAVEGLEVAPGRHYLAAESDAEFAEVLAQLATEPALGAEIVTQGWQLVRDRYSLAAVDDSVRAALAAMRPGPRARGRP